MGGGRGDGMEDTYERRYWALAVALCDFFLE